MCETRDFVIVEDTMIHSVVNVSEQHTECSVGLRLGSADFN
jgi:hypothetical protein